MLLLKVLANLIQKHDSKLSKMTCCVEYLEQGLRYEARECRFEPRLWHQKKERFVPFREVLTVGRDGRIESLLEYVKDMFGSVYHFMTHNDNAKYFSVKHTKKQHVAISVTQAQALVSLNRRSQAEILSKEVSTCVEVQEVVEGLSEKNIAQGDADGENEDEEGIIDITKEARLICAYADHGGSCPWSVSAATGLVKLLKAVTMTLRAMPPVAQNTGKRNATVATLQRNLMNACSQLRLAPRRIGKQKASAQAVNVEGWIGSQFGDLKKFVCAFDQYFICQAPSAPVSSSRAPSLEHQHHVTLRHIHLDFDVRTGRATHDMRRGQYDIPAKKALRPGCLDAAKFFKVRFHK